MYADFLVCGAVSSAVPPEEVHVREHLFELLLLCVVVVPVNHNLTRKVISSIIIKISKSNHPGVDKTRIEPCKHQGY